MGTDTLIGSEIAGLRIDALVGRGGMGTVYRAHDVELGRTVAIKVLAPELADSERFRDRFLRETRIAASLDHPNIVPIYSAGEADGVLYLAMRYVAGADLARLIEDGGPLDPKRALALIEQVASALDTAHEQGLVHRDVKSSNILVSLSAGREVCYLGDFGLTKRRGTISGLTAADQVVGTLDYIAPEQIQGDEAEAAADVYSLACVLYECLTGSPPFDRATDVAVLWGHVHDEPPTVSSRRPELPPALDAVLARGLAKAPADRYASAGELAAAAREALAPPARPPDQRPGRRAAPAFLIVVLVAAVAVAALLLLRDGGGGGPAAVSPNAVGIIDAERDALAGEIPVGAGPAAIAVGDGAVWVANVEDGTVSRIDPEARRVLRTIPLGDPPSDIAVDPQSAWVALGGLGAVARINPDQNTAATPVSALAGEDACQTPQASITFGGGFLWLACREPDLGRVDPRTGSSSRIGVEAALLTSASAERPEFSDVGFAFGSLWLVNRTANSVIEVEPGSGQKLGELTVGRGPAALAVGPDSLWIVNFDDDTLTRITISEPGQTPTLTTVPVGDGPVDVAVGEGGVWVITQLDRTVVRIDPETNEVVATIDVGNDPQGVAAGAGAVWVTVRASDPATSAP